jgi:hypothetical protein
MAITMNSVASSRRQGGSNALKNKKGAPATLGAPTITFAAVLTETATDILEPWPVKIVVD